MSEKHSLLTLSATGLIGIAAISHLIFTAVQTKALLLLENEICGFIMFVFVLFGLVALFEATQIKPNKRFPMLITALFALMASGTGILLIRIYRQAIANQQQLNVDTVNLAAGFSTALVITFTAAAVLLVIDFVRRRGKQ